MSSNILSPIHSKINPDCADSGPPLSPPPQSKSKVSQPLRLQSFQAHVAKEQKQSAIDSYIQPLPVPSKRRSSGSQLATRISFYGNEATAMAEGLCHDDEPENLLATKFKHNGINSHISLLIFLLVADYDPGMYKEVSIDFVNKYQHTHLHTYIQISQVVGWQKCSFSERSCLRSRMAGVSR